MLNTFAEAADIRALNPDRVILATGSLPDPDGTQRWLPGEPRLPGIDLGGVWSPEDVLRRDARLGDAVILYDEGGNWRGLGTAWWLVEQGKTVTIVTPEPFVGREIARTSADAPLRARLARAGVRMLTESAIAAWHGDGATVLSLLTRASERVAASALVMSTTNRAFDPVSAEIADLSPILIGDAAAPRHAPYAFHDGRRAALSL
jgi:NADPH-dependent 2,4-dienoyl-CoA reductase/sulfur reductase-like enzyme